MWSLSCWFLLTFFNRSKIQNTRYKIISLRQAIMVITGKCLMMRINSLYIPVTAQNDSMSPKVVCNLIHWTIEVQDTEWCCFKIHDDLISFSFMMMMMMMSIYLLLLLRCLAMTPAETMSCFLENRLMDLEGWAEKGVIQKGLTIP